MDNFLGIEDVNLVLHQNIQGSCYVSDKFGGLIGWYDYNLKILHVDERYKHITKLIEICLNCDFQLNPCFIKEPEVLKYFAERRIRLKKYYEEKKLLNKKLDEQMKYLPSRRKTKNAKKKMDKRHD